MKPKALITVFLLILILFPHSASGEGSADFVRLRERSRDGYLLTVYRGNSVDYRSSLLIEFTDSLVEHYRLKIEADLVRKGGVAFEIPVPVYSYMTDSGFVAYQRRDYDPGSEVPLEDTHIDLTKWAVEPGDELHLKIHDVSYAYLLERRIPIGRHGLQGNFSFPFLSVQRAGEHPGSLGAGIGYTLRHVQAERTLLNKLGFGINLSFLDFEAGQKVEIGLGLAVSFPDDLFHVGAGKNLTVNRDTGYYFLGINLPAVIEKVGL
ncbi:MAG: hypothetical protein JSV10_09325 [Candidatus Zixiibacteriota bacterium]|nr:MAG: hypothetical protein JSV10_09325 [candidate division Zixibacteria bacterium]